MYNYNVSIYEKGVKIAAKLFCLSFSALEIQGKLLPRRVVAESPGCWLLAGTELGPKGHKAGGWGGSQREALFAEKLVIFFAGQSWLAVLCRLSDWQPASNTQAR